MDTKDKRNGPVFVDLILDKMAATRGLCSLLVFLFLSIERFSSTSFPELFLSM